MIRVDQGGLADGGDVWTRAFLSGVRPPETLRVSEWAECHAKLPAEGSAETGDYRIVRTPYVREVLDALGPDDPCQFVTLAWAAQTAKTTVGIVWLSFAMCHDPGPILVVQPTVDMAKRYSGQRIGPTIAATPELRRVVGTRRSRDAGNTTFLKSFPGGVLLMTGANSAAGLRAMPIRRLHRDEIDAYPDDLAGEGDPCDLAEARTRTFRTSRKILDTSTPSIRGRSRIERRYEVSDRRSFWVPCVGCGEFQILRFAQLQFDRDHPEETARYRCEFCGDDWEESAKDRFLAAGEWRPENPERTHDHRGYHLSALYSPLGWRSWGEIAAQAVRAKRDQAAARSFVNLDLAESYEEPGDSPEWELAYARRESYPIGTVPKGGILLTAGVDVQADRIHGEIVAWGRNMESWSVDYFVVDGSISTESACRELADRLFVRRFKVEGGGLAAVRMAAIDAGYETQHVYGFVRQAPSGRAMAVKGREGGSVLLGTPRDVYHRPKRGGRRRTLKLWTVYGEVAKSELYACLRLPEPETPGAPYPRGYVHFPNYSPDFFRELTSERIVRRFRRGVPYYVWEAQGRNEALDCRVYARAAGYLCGIDRATPEHWKRLEDELRGIGPAPKAAPKRRQSGASARAEAAARNAAARRGIDR